ncbi:MAG: hypothetical protein QNJ54_02170 [Prochloraceae cyanobacterium]|nr:hypothetical protein [Prochloraceae cyanobacterium]
MISDRSLQELIWAIQMSEGQFSLILARCNYLPLQKQIGERLHKLPSLQIQKVFLDTSVNKLYSTIQKQLKEEQPSAVMVFGLESVKDIERLIISANQVREEFRKNFHFPLVLWVTDEISSKLIRLAPDLESWTTSIYFPCTQRAPICGVVKP